MSKTGYGSIRIGDIIEWAEANQDIPDDFTELFVLNHETSEPNTSKPFFRFVISSKILLQNALKSNIVHIDATYKLIWSGFPVFVIGTTDMQRKFHLIGVGVSVFEQEPDFAFMLQSVRTFIESILHKQYTPKVLVSYAAHSITNAYDSVFPDDKNIKIMCYYHMITNVERNKNKVDKSVWPDVKKDIEAFHLAPSTLNFKKALRLFMLKYKEQDKFCDYFRKTWVEQNPNWYEGVKHFTPSTNNALEGFNNSIKRDFSYRRRLSLPDFSKLMYEIVETISTKYINGEKFSKPNKR